MLIISIAFRDPFYSLERSNTEGPGSWIFNTDRTEGRGEFFPPGIDLDIYG